MDPTRSRGWGWWARQVAGWGLILAGIAGLFLPFLQGILFLVMGLALLSRDSPWARRWLERIKERVKQTKEKRHDD